MTTFNWPGFGIASVTWTLDQPAQVNRSAYTGVRAVAANPWHGKWSFKVQLATRQGDSNFQAVRAFFTLLKGQTNNFHLPAVEAPQNANSSVTLSAAAAQGAFTITLTGLTTALAPGNMVTIAGQLLSIVTVGSLSGSVQSINFMPTLRAAAASGTAVETAKPYALVALSDSSFSWDIAQWRQYGLSFTADEDVGGVDGADPTLDIWSGGTGTSGGGGVSYSFPQLTSFITRSLLAAVASPSNKQVAFLTEAGREGTFIFSSANLASFVTADTAQGIYVPPAVDTTGASGAWVRQYQAGTVFANWFGAIADGTTDNLAASAAALNALDFLGGGEVRYGAGTYAHAGQLPVGNGTNSATSTKHHRISLVGVGYGSGNDLSNTEYIGATRFLYTGSSSATAAVVSFEGPLHSPGMSNIQVDANGLAGFGINFNHITQATFERVAARNYTAVGWNGTTRTGFPTGAPYGCADNRFYDCYGWNPANFTALGISLNSGVSTSTTLVGNPDCARNIFIGGTFGYGGNTGSYGAYLSGADNNQFLLAEFQPKGGNAGGGFDVYFDQWPASPVFPLENLFSGGGMTRGVTGSSGAVGNNTFAPFSTSDGAVPSSLPGAQTQTHDGKSYVNGVRAYRGRQLATYSTQTPVTIASATEADLTGYTLTFTTAASTKLLIRYTARVAKDTTGTGYITANIDGSDYGVTYRDAGATGYYQSAAAEIEIDVGAGSHTVKLRFASSDTNTFHVDRGSLTVQELY